MWHYNRLALMIALAGCGQPDRFSTAPDRIEVTVEMSREPIATSHGRQIQVCASEAQPWGNGSTEVDLTNEGPGNVDMEAVWTFDRAPKDGVGLTPTFIVDGVHSTEAVLREGDTVVLWVGANVYCGTTSVDDWLGEHTLPLELRGVAAAEGGDGQLELSGFSDEIPVTVSVE